MTEDDPAGEKAGQQGDDGGDHDETGVSVGAEGEGPEQRRDFGPARRGGGPVRQRRRGEEEGQAADPPPIAAP